MISGPSNPFFDQEAMYRVMEQAAEAVRPIGLTFEPSQVQFAIVEGQLVAMVQMLVRETAKERLDEDRESREAFNQQMRANHEAKIEAERQKILKATMSDEDFEKFLNDELDDECDHTNRHPDGFCLDCGHGMDDRGLEDIMKDWNDE